MKIRLTMTSKKEYEIALDPSLKELDILREIESARKSNQFFRVIGTDDLFNLDLIEKITILEKPEVKPVPQVPSQPTKTIQQLQLEKQPLINQLSGVYNGD